MTRAMIDLLTAVAAVYVTITALGAVAVVSVCYIDKGEDIRAFGWLQVWAVALVFSAAWPLILMSYVTADRF